MANGVNNGVDFDAEEHPNVYAISHQPSAISHQPSAISH
jgi:hypothetical protein